MSKEELYEYVRDSFNKISIDPIDINSNDYWHHNTTYQNTPLVMQYGILSLKQLNAMKLKNLTEKEMIIMDDTSSHINGINGVSLSKKVYDLSPKEAEYDPQSMESVDIMIDSSVVAMRDSTNYGNEYICYNPISPKTFKTIDIRLLKLLTSTYCHVSTKEMIQRYNFLRDIAIEIKRLRLPISLRDMSCEQINLNIDELTKIKKIEM